jgi:hypothetical protein
MRRRLLAFVGGGLVWPGRSVAARPGGVGQWRREPHHPAVDGDVVDLDAAEVTPVEVRTARLLAAR